MALPAPAIIRVPAATRFTTMLVATDFSAASEAALHFASALARRQGAQLFLFHALGFEPGYPKPMQSAP